MNEKRKFDELVEIDGLVFSSHKTSTQTLVGTLRRSSQKAVHGHTLRHLNFVEGDFAEFLPYYHMKNKRPLVIHTVFREPVSRLISSFFQTHGSDMLDFGHIESQEESILSLQTNDELRHTFICGMRQKSLLGYVESLDILVDELGISYSDLEFDPKKRYSIYRDKFFEIVLLRFDSLVTAYGKILEAILNRKVRVQKSNISNRKWYREIYRGFLQAIRIPRSDICSVYEDKRELVKLFYPSDHEQQLNETIEKYAA